MRKDEVIYVAGHDGMVGSAVVRALEAEGYERVIGRPIAELDLRDAAQVRDFFDAERPDYVILAAARVGGIQANVKHPAEFLYDNLTMQCNVIHQAFLHNVRKLCFLGSSCVYPRQCPQPMREEYLLTGPLEPTNEGYAIAKIAGLKMVEYYRRQYGFSGVSLMPCNLYGTNDHFDFENGHVLASLVRRFVEAVDEQTAGVTVWGTGSAKREFMHVDDAARAVLFAMESYDAGEILNVGWGEDVSIKELAETVASLAGFTGRLEWDRTKPDGMPRKCMDVSRMRALGFSPRITLREGIERTIGEYRASQIGRTEH
ncbi:MAG: GDP-L-fucose synthase [Polyangiaceae bacterium]|nr:GDP-L-fucose synthase [Polyangiaceae bacterium]